MYKLRFCQGAQGSSARPISEASAESHDCGEAASLATTQIVTALG